MLGASLEEVITPRASLEVVMLAVARVPAGGAGLLGCRSWEGGVGLRRRSSVTARPVRVVHQRWRRLPGRDHCGGHFVARSIDIGGRRGARVRAKL